MNGENNHVFHTSALDGMTLNPIRPRYSWTLFRAHLWLLGAFVAMSLVVASARSLITGDESPAVSAVLAIAGIALFPISWRNVALLLDRGENAPRSDTEGTPQDGATAGPMHQLELGLRR